MWVAVLAHLRTWSASQFSGIEGPRVALLWVHLVVLWVQELSGFMSHLEHLCSTCLCRYFVHTCHHYGPLRVAF